LADNEKKSGKDGKTGDRAERCAIPLIYEPDVT
jgi:hypothetical protein